MSKMYGLSPKTPLIYNEQDGPYRLTKTIGEVVQQNLKNLVLTSKGERIMLPEFGCGLNQYFFEPMAPMLYEAIATEIMEQVTLYMNFVNIEDITFITTEDDPELDYNQVGVKITYNIPGVNSSDTLQINTLGV